MNNEEKATEISKQYFGEPNQVITWQAAMKMAEWKDEQLESKLMQIIILAQQGYTSGATDEMILKQCKEVINENVKL